ncbi:iron transporter [Rhodanobacter sp. FW510-R12]|nr:MAG: cupredoxin domain-containing protein [Rhodanobacter sp.]
MREAVGAWAVTIALGVAACLFASTSAAAELPAYTLVAKDGRLTPAVLDVPAQTRFKIIVRNDGSEPIEFESLQLRKEKVLAPGAQSFVVIAPLRPGEYEFFDDFHPDSGRGRIVAK